MGNPVQIHTNMDNAPTFYANFVQATATQIDFKLVVGQIVEAAPNQVTVRDIASIYMTPQIGKMLLDVLASVVKQHEQRLGPITVPQETAEQRSKDAISSA